MPLMGFGASDALSQSGGQAHRSSVPTDFSSRYGDQQAQRCDLLPFARSGPMA